MTNPKKTTVKPRRTSRRLAIVLLLGLAMTGGLAANLSAARANGIDPGGSFRLIDHRGKQVTDKDYRGRYLLVFFGYTACPDVCPTTLLNVTRALTLLGPRARRISALFITVDPARDTPRVLARYLDLFDAPITGLTGRPDQIRSVAKAYKTFFKKAPAEGAPDLASHDYASHDHGRTGDHDDYTMEHSAFLYLMGPDGGFLEVFGYATPPKKMAETISRFLAKPGL